MNHKEELLRGLWASPQENRAPGSDRDLPRFEDGGALFLTGSNEGFSA